MEKIYDYFRHICFAFLKGIKAVYKSNYLKILYDLQLWEKWSTYESLWTLSEVKTSPWFRKV